MISKSFFENLELIANEKGLAIEDVLAKVEIAMAVACRDTDHNGDIKLDIDYDKKRIRVFEYKYVVEEVTEGNKGEITVEEAKELKPRAKIEPGTTFKEEIDFTKLGRKSVAKFKNTFNNELKTLEREEAFNFFNEKVKDIISGICVDSSADYALFSIGKSTFVSLSKDDLIPGEVIKRGDRRKLYITKVEKTTKGPKINASRSCKEFVIKLFELNIPEIKDGSIELMGISRIAGSRSKVGVMAIKPNLDARGSCIGAGGLRIKAITDELNQEKIDVFLWKTDPVDLIAQSLLPARSLSVVIQSTKPKQALVICTDEQYSLAIGKGGQNVRLACFATSWKIDVKKLSDALKEGIDFTYNVY